MASAVNDSIAELGGSFGVAVLGAMLSVTYGGSIDAALARAGTAIREAPIASPRRPSSPSSDGRC